MVFQRKRFMMFFHQKNIKLSKNYTTKLLFNHIKHTIFYHSVTKYFGNKERKYLYAVFDFPTSNTNYKLSKRKKGNNDNIFGKFL